MSHTTQIIDHKRGATFSYAGTLALPAGTWSAACQARDSSGTLVQTFDVTLTAPVAPATDHSITIRAESTDTDDWTKDAVLRCDVVFTDAASPANVVPTSTFAIRVTDWVTHG